MAKPNIERDVFGDTDQEILLMSIAISLKRLADLLDRFEYRGALMVQNRGN